MVWTWTQHAHGREKFEQAMIDGSWNHATVHRLRSQAEVDRLLEALAQH